MAAFTNLKCPYCASEMVARIVYGKQTHTREFEHDLKAGRIIFGRGEPNEKSPHYQCQDCGIEWGSYPKRPFD